MYQRILVPVDGSDVSDTGLREAMRLARDQHARLRLIHVVSEVAILSAYEAAAFSEELLKALRLQGEKVLAAASAQVAAAGLNAETALIEALGTHAGDAIVKDAHEWPADIIVLGTHGRRGLARLLMGSDAEQVVRQANVPVLLVKSSLSSG